MSGASEASMRGEPEDGGGFVLSDLLGIARRRWPIVVSLTLVVTLLVGGIAYLLPKRYEASATVLIEPRKTTVINMEQVVSELRADTPTVESEVEILGSRAIATRVIELLGLRGDVEFEDSLGIGAQVMKYLGLKRATMPVMAEAEPARGGLSSSLTDPNSTRGIVDTIFAQMGYDTAEPARDEIVDAFQSRLKVARVKNTFLIEIKYQSRNAAKAARIANAIAEVYLKEQIAAKLKATELANEWLEHKIEGLRKKVFDAETAVAQFKTQNNLFDSDGQLLSDKQLGRVMEQSLVARTQTEETRQKYLQVRRLMAGGEGRAAIADVLQSGTIRLHKDQLARIKQREAELLTKYGPKHPELQKVKAEVADIQRQIESEVDQILASLKNEYEVAEGREKSLTANLGALKNQQVLSKEAAIRLRELERDSNTSRTVFEAFLTRYKQTAEQQGIQLPDARIVEHAGMPLFPSKPKRKMIVLAAFGFSLVLACGLAVLLDCVGAGIAKPEEIEGGLHIAALSQLPSIKSVAGRHGELKSIRLMLAEPQGQFAEAMRAVRLDIDARATLRGPRIVLVTSAQPGDGKSLVASNLAHAFAISGTRTLLVDGDLRCQKLSKLLLPEGRRGLYDCTLTGTAADQLVLRDGVSGLSFLAAGGDPGSADGSVAAPAEALCSPNLKRLLSMLRLRFDMIVIDAPPVLPVVDARILAEHADQIVFVTRWRKTPRDVARRAIRSLGPHADKIAGAVLNQVGISEFANGYALSDRAISGTGPRQSPALLGRRAA